MADVVVTFQDASVEASCRELTGKERLGEAGTFAVELFSTKPLDRSAVVGKGCRLNLSNKHGERAIPGVVMAFTALATSNPEAGRRYRIEVRSAFAVLELTRRSRILNT